MSQERVYELFEGAETALSTLGTVLALSGYRSLALEVVSLTFDLSSIREDYDKTTKDPA